MHIENVVIHINQPINPLALARNPEAVFDQFVALFGPLPTGDAMPASTPKTQAVPTCSRRPAEVVAAPNLQPPAAGEIWPGQGGRFICTLPAMPGRAACHLVLAEERAEELAWGGDNNDIAAARSHYDGQANTAALIACSTAHPAAAWAAAVEAEGHRSFHLPSRLDLLMAFIHTPQLFEKSGWYWSSTQCSRGNAFAQDFEYGGSDALLKVTECRAVAVRTIQLQPFNA